MRSIPVLFAAVFLSGCLSAGSSGTPTSVNRSAMSSTSSVGNMPLGVSGSGGLTEELLGSDILTPLIGGEGLVGATLGGGSDGPMAGNVPDGGLAPPGTLSPVVDALAQIESAAPQLGASGTGGLGEDLFGHDISGMLLGTSSGAIPVLLSGGNDAPLGGLVPEGTAPLAPVGDLLADIIVGAQSDSSQGNLNELSPVLSPIILGLLGAGGDGSGPVPGVAVPSLPIDELSPVLGPTSLVATQLLATPLLPNGTTANEIVFPLALGAVAGVADAALPLGTVADTLVGVLP